MQIPALLSLLLLAATIAPAQEPPYDNPPDVAPPYYRVRFEASNKAGELIFPVQYTVWIPEGVETLRGIIVHQHGCGEGSCQSGQTGAFDLHWQALAKKHDCALLSPSYEQPQAADCQMWCDPRNGSDDAFRKGLAALGEKSGHTELVDLSWALWGHSGGGHWCGGMTLLHPERTIATWHRSGLPLFEPNPDRATIKPHQLPQAALGVPMMCNPGTKEGVTVKEGKFARVWPANETFFEAVRGKGGLIGVAVDPLTAHECGNQRYMAIPWLDACLSARLPEEPGAPLEAMPTEEAWLAPLLGATAVPESVYQGDKTKAVWLPNETIAKAWMRYTKDTNIPDTTPPPAPTELKVEGNILTWRAEADLENGISHFIIERNSQPITTVPENPTNRFGRPLFQGLQYSDTPEAPLVKMRFVDPEGNAAGKRTYRVRAVNTAGLKSE